ncbi:MAG: hypothetical protein HQL32_13870 [Planctomycetes bacterium]|nr:hypothetical protein [Planctomycetota bacterium]
MNILIDGQSDLLNTKEGYDKENLLTSIESILHSSGRTIAEIRFNGQDINLDEADQYFQSITPHSDAILEIKTGDLQEYLKQLVDTIESYLGTTEAKALDISEKLLMKNNDGAFEEIGQWSGEFMSLINNLLEFIEVFNIPQENLVIGSDSFEEGIAKIQTFLEKINDGIKSENHTAVSELMEFDISSFISDLRAIFPALKHRLEEVFSA